MDTRDPGSGCDNHALAGPTFAVMSDCCSIWEKFEPDKNLVKEYRYWKLLVRKNQVKLGSCVAITKQHHTALGELSRDEMAEYRSVAWELECALNKLFNYDVVHHLMLMFVDKHTHFHIIPRYEKPRSFAGMEWVDDYQADPLIQKRDPVAQEVLSQIRDQIKSEIV